jgi:hypothetical protein
MGLTHRFFLVAGGLNYFPEIKDFNGLVAVRNREVESLQAVAPQPHGRPALPAAIFGELFSRHRAAVVLSQKRRESQGGGGGYETAD